MVFSTFYENITKHHFYDLNDIFKHVVYFTEHELLVSFCDILGLSGNFFREFYITLHYV